VILRLITLFAFVLLSWTVSRALPFADPTVLAWPIGLRLSTVVGLALGWVVSSRIK